VVFSLGALAAACGSSDDSTPTTTAQGGKGGAAGAAGAGAGGDEQGGAGGDEQGGAGGDAQGGAGGDSGAGGAAVQKVFQVTLQSIYGFNGAKPMDYYNIGIAYALIATPPGDLMKCTIEAVDSCSLAICQTGAMGSGGEIPVKASAGDITITGASTTPISLKQDANGLYSSTTPIPSNKPLFTGGEALTATATGGTAAPGVKPFELHATAPTPAKVGGIVLPDDPTKALDLDTSSDITISSDDQSKDTLQVVITAGMQGGTQAASLYCLKTLDGTGLTISSSTLQKLKAVSPSALRYVSQVHKESTQIQDLTLRFAVETNVFTKNNKPVAGLALLNLK
jgi:hypothetical protein